MRSIHNWMATVGITLLVGCSDWPPQEQKFIDLFNENRAGIETLKLMLEESKYESVGLDSRGRVRGLRFEGDPNIGQVGHREQLDESDEWADQFNKVGVDSIQEHDDGGVMLSAGIYVREKGFESYASFVQSPDIQNRIQRCDDSHANVACGKCIVSLDTGWWLEYGWWPSDLTDMELEAWNNEDMSEEEYRLISDQIFDSCFVDGGTLIESQSN